MTHLELENEILQAFRGVTLDGGVSLLQAQVMDNYGEGVTHAQFLKLPRQEITDDWTAIPWQSLEFPAYLCYLDGKGFRYYLPACLLGFLNGYDVEFFLSLLHPIYNDRDYHPVRQFSHPAKGGRPSYSATWEHYMERYSSLNIEQRTAVAHFLQVLPQWFHLDRRQRWDVEGALESFWDQYLNMNSSP